MALPTPVNGQITDAVTQSNLSVLGIAPAVAMSTVYQTMAHSISVMFENNTQAQRQAAICGQAATNMGVMHLYSGPTMAAAASTSKISGSDTPNDMMALLAALAMAAK